MSMGHVLLDLDELQLTGEEKEILRHPQVGGVILFKRNYESKNQLKQLTKQIRKCKEELFITVDQEGGRVQRFQSEFVQLPAFAKYGQLYDNNPPEALKEAEKMAYFMANELLDCGVDLSFTPVLDVDAGVSTVIGDRSFHKNVETVIDIAQAFITGMHKAGMPATGKHFPGHGAVVADSHLTLPIDTRTYDEIASKDLQPFVKLCSILSAIMPAHVLYKQVDEYPAGFSRVWLQNILREKLQFSGVIFSDDLSMLGAQIVGDCVERARAALSAGCDMLIICHNRGDVVDVLDEFETYDDPISNERLLNLRNAGR